MHRIFQAIIDHLSSAQDPRPFVRVWQKQRPLSTFLASHIFLFRISQEPTRD